MGFDPYTALWVSYSSLSDFTQCPRSYYLKNVYRDKASGKKIKLVSPPLSVGQAVHEVIEMLASLRTDERFKKPLLVSLDEAWQKVRGKLGGFFTAETEDVYKERAKAMLRRVTEHPGAVARKAVKITMNLPHYTLSEKDNIILCGRIDWLEYLEDTDSVHIIDFKTGKGDEPGDSLQLPIYYLLVKNCQRRAIAKASYWYLERNDDLTELSLPNPQESEVRVLAIAKQIKLAKQLDRFKCPGGEKGCVYCHQYEAILEGNAELVGSDERSLFYALDPSLQDEAGGSVIL